MSPDAKLRMGIYQEGQRAFSSGATCPYTDWRAKTWAKGRAAAEEWHASIQLMDEQCEPLKALAEAEKQEQPLPPVEIGVDVTAEGATVVGFYRRPDALMEMFYSQFHPQPKREWVGLTHSDIDQGLLRSDYALKTAEAWRAGVVFAMTKLKDKNT